MVNFRLKFFVILGLFLPVVVFAGTILSAHSYAWSNNVGYINFVSTTVGNASLGGYAWSTNAGWITMSPAAGGVSNDGAGHLSGFAWGEQLGWIDFSGVSINSSTGKFSGTAKGTIVGSITFDCHHCDVLTDWRPPAVSSVATTQQNTGGGGPILGFGVSQAPKNAPNVPTVSNPIANKTSAAAQSSRGAPAIGGNAGTPSVQAPAQKSALFDIISSPVQPAGQSPFPFFVFAIMAEIAVIALVVIIVRRIKARRAAKAKMNEEINAAEV